MIEHCLCHEEIIFNLKSYILRESRLIECLVYLIEFFFSVISFYFVSCSGEVCALCLAATPQIMQLRLVYINKGVEDVMSCACAECI